MSLWEIEPLTTFPMYPSPFPLRLKRPWPTGLPSLHGMRCSYVMLACRYVSLLHNFTICILWPITLNVMSNHRWEG